MRKLTGLILLLGGLIMITSLTACGSPDPNAQVRTPGQLKLEKEFEPLFEFLAQEKKDFSTVKRYKSSIFETDRKTGAEKNSSVNFEQLANNKEGTYTITEGSQEKDYPVSIDDQGNLVYSTPVPQEFDGNIFHLSLENGFFRKLPISDYMAEHPETYMKDISYKVNAQVPFLSKLIEKYDINQDTDISLYLEKYYEEKDMVYALRISFVDDYKILDIINKVTFKEDKGD